VAAAAAAAVAARRARARRINWEHVDEPYFATWPIPLCTSKQAARALGHAAVTAEEIT
jgi:hypothetical protein